MDPTVRARFTTGHLSELAQRYGTAVDSLRVPDRFGSFVFDDRGHERVIRVGHSARRTADLVRAEVDWLLYLAAHDVPVAEALTSTGGRLIEQLDDGAGGQFVAVAFRRTRGEQLEIREWTPAFTRHYGAVLGRMHRVSVDYEPRLRRPSWDAPSMLAVRRHIPSDQPLVRDAWDRVLARVRNWACSPSQFGLIHQDAHGENFFVDDRRITLFDFDDCCYGPFAMEIGIVIFYAAVLLDEPDDFAAWFVPNLLAGYRSEIDTRLDSKALQDCIALRETDTYGTVWRDGEQDSDHPWTSGFMRGRRQRIQRGTPLIEIRPEWMPARVSGCLGRP